MKNLVLPILAFIIILTSCQKESSVVSPVSDTVENREKHSICIETYNTYLLDTPGIGFGPQCDGADCERRAQAICDQATSNGADIINLQEVWIGGNARKILIDCLKSKGYTVLEDSNCDNGGVLNQDNDCTGLLTATKLNVVNTQIEFFDCGTGYDKHKEKGFQINKFELEAGCTMYNINTHLQAEDDEASRNCRLEQIKQIHSKIKTLPTGIPVYLAGDFNIRYGSPDYLKLVALGTDVYSLTGSVPSLTNREGDVLDYVLFNDVKSNTIITSVQAPSSGTYKKYYLKIICEDQVIEVGEFSSYIEVQNYPVPAGCKKKITEETYVQAPFNPISDHFQVTVCLEYNCDDQLDTIDEPSQEELACIEQGCEWADLRCFCK